MPTVDKEPEVTKQISNETVNLYFYYMFVIVVLITGFSVVMDLYVATRNARLGLGLLLRSAPMFIIAVLNSMFLYILSSRTLPAGK